MAKIWQIADKGRVLGFLVHDGDTWMHVSPEGVHAMDDHPDPLAAVPRATPVPDVEGSAREVADLLFRNRPGGGNDVANLIDPPLL